MRRRSWASHGHWFGVEWMWAICRSAASVPIGAFGSPTCLRSGATRHPPEPRWRSCGPTRKTSWRMASDPRPLAPPVVLVDANLLYPFHLRNLLIQFGVERLIDLRWTACLRDARICDLNGPTPGRDVTDHRTTRYTCP